MSTIIGTLGDDHLTGNAGDDTIYGGAGNDALSGNDGADHLVGGAGDDHLYGGAGADFLTGGAGADTFFFGPGDSGVVGTERDRITDFVHGVDLIDLTQLHLSSISEVSFSPLSAAVEVVSIDTNGDTTPDLQIQVHHIGAALTTADFVI